MFKKYIKNLNYNSVRDILKVFPNYHNSKKLNFCEKIIFKNEVLQKMVDKNNVLQKFIDKFELSINVDFIEFKEVFKKKL